MAKKGLKITIGIVSIIAIGILVWLMFFKKDSKIYVLKGRGSGLDPLQPGEAESGTAQSANEISSPAPSGSTGGGSFWSGSTTGNPFTSSAEIQAFQQYVLDVHKDSAILGGFGADGQWGTNTANAYKKYGDQYNAFKDPQSPVIANLEKANLNYSKPSDGSVRVVFNRGNYKYVARWYPNGRVVFYINGKQEHLSKGNYSDGGKKIVITEGRRNGSTFNNSSILTNMQNAIAPTTSTTTTSSIVNKNVKARFDTPIRSTPKKIDGIGSNKIGKVSKGKLVGRVMSVKKGSSATTTWYKVQLQTGIMVYTTYLGAPVPTPTFEGWVRSDMVKAL